MTTLKDQVFANHEAEANKENGQGNLMINYLPPDMQDIELHELFVNFGDIKRTKIIRDTQTGASNCYGFVEFEAAENAKLAQIAVNGRRVRGKTLKVSVARPSSDKIKNAKLYVANIPLWFDEEKLLSLFQHFGKIMTLNILRTKTTGLSRGIGFVHFDCRSSAETAVSVMNGYLLDDKTQLIVKSAVRPNHYTAYNANSSPSGTKRPFEGDSLDSPVVSIKKERKAENFMKRSRLVDSNAKDNQRSWATLQPIRNGHFRMGAASANGNYGFLRNTFENWNPDPWEINRSDNIKQAAGQKRSYVDSF